MKNENKKELVRWKQKYSERQAQEKPQKGIESKTED